jgi:hypothetical protein
VQHQAAIPGPGRHVGDRVGVAAQEPALGEVAVENVELPLHLHGVAIDGILELLGRIGVEVAEAAPQEGRAGHLPEEPRQAFRARTRLARKEGVELLGQVDQDRAGLEDAGRRRRAPVEERRDLGVGVHGHEAASELLPLADVDEVGVVLGALPADRQQLLQEHGHLHAVRGRQRVELEGVLAHRQGLLVGRSRDRAVDLREAPTALGIPFPDPGRCVDG